MIVDEIYLCKSDQFNLWYIAIGKMSEVPFNALVCIPYDRLSKPHIPVFMFAPITTHEKDILSLMGCIEEENYSDLLSFFEFKTLISSCSFQAQKIM